MEVASFKLLLVLSLITVICANEADFGEFFTPVSGEKVINAKDSQSPFLSEEFFACRQSQSCVVAKNTQVWKKVPVKKDYKNLAKHKRTRMSTAKAEGRLAVDGIKSKRAPCSTTENTGLAGAWWEVDLSAKAVIDSVSITPRSECCLVLMEDFDITMKNDIHDKAVRYCRRNARMKAMKTESFKCEKVNIGRYLTIKSNIARRISLCEVEVFGVYI